MSAFDIGIEGASVVAMRGLTKSQFGDALRKGLGRALQDTLATGALRDERAALEACVHNQAYDPQIEGSRTLWMVQILDAANAVSRLGAAILDGFAAVSKSCWDLVQLCEFAEALARRGVPGAREKLYETFASSFDPNCPWSAYGAIMRLDGVSGLLRIVDDRGTRIIADPEEAWRFDDILWLANDILGIDETKSALETAAKSNPRVSAFLDSQRLLEAQQQLDSQSRSAERHRLLSLSGRQLVAEVYQSAPGERLPWLRGWARKAASAEVAPITDALESEQVPERIQQLLQAYERPPDGAVPRIITLTSHEDLEVRRRAFLVLKHARHPSVRALALQRAKAGLADDETLGLFVSNYEVGDHRFLERMLTGFDGGEDLHSFCMQLRKVFETNRTDAAKKSMLFVYERTPCAECRHGSVKVMHASGILPSSVAEECRYDSEEDTRTLVEATTCAK